MDPLTLALILGGAGLYFFGKKKVAPPVSPGTSTPGTSTPGDGIPPDLWGRINATIQNENDVEKLRTLERELVNYRPQTEQTAFALTILRQKIAMLESGATPPIAPPISPPGTAEKTLPRKMQELLAAILEGLTVQMDGTLIGPIADDAIQRATSLAGQLERAGFPAYAEDLRRYIDRAKAFLPTKQPDITPKPPDVSPDLWARIQATLRYERDPQRLRELLAVMQAYRPESVQMTGAIESLKLLIASIESSEVVSDTMTKIDEIIPKDTGPGPETTTPPVEPPVTIEPKTRVEVLAESVALNLRGAQQKHGMPGAKGKEDQKLVASFQKEAGLKPDGLSGPLTTVKLAQSGVTVLPFVMYWPKAATAKTVADYKKALGSIAESLSGSKRAELLASVTAEKGFA